MSQKNYYYYDTERVADPKAYKRPRYPVWVEALKVSLLFAVPCMLLLYIAYDVGGGTYRYYPYCLVYLAMPALSVAVRRTVKNIFPFLGLFVLFGLYVTVSPNIVITIMAIVLEAMLFLYNMVRQLSHEPEQEAGTITLIGGIVGLVAIYAAAYFRGMEGYNSMILIQGMIFVVLYLFYEHQVNISTTLKAMDKGSNFSTHQVVRFNNGMYAVFALLTVALFVIFYLLGVSDWLIIAGKAIWLLIRRLIALLSRGGSSEEQEEVIEEQEQQVQQDIQNMLPAGDTGVFWIVLQKIAEVAVIVFLVFLAGYLVVKLIRNFHASDRYQSKEYTEEKSFTMDLKPKKRRSSRLSLLDRSPENRIRREYYRKVRKKMDHEVQRSDAPQEVAEKLPEVRDIVQSYEDVRYGSTKPETDRT